MANNFIDLTGKIYENFTVIEKGNGRYTKGGQYKITWVCLCSCGNIFEVDGEKIRNGKVFSCGCMRYSGRERYYADLTGQRFGRLTVIRRLRPDEVETRQYNWLCRCDCGKEVKASANKLKIGHTKSCGCLKREFSIGDATRTHGKRGSKLYYIHASMKQRCYNKNSVSYKYYGARGIQVCEYWLGKDGFKHFYEWAIGTGFDENKKWTEQTIDRINVDGDYSPENCRWVDASTQSRNRRFKKK